MNLDLLNKAYIDLQARANGKGWRIKLYKEPWDNHFLNVCKAALVVVIGLIIFVLVMVVARQAEGTESHFKSKEFACKHCGQVLIAKGLMEKLETLRAELGKPIIINSAYRCSLHNQSVGGVKRSQHTLGRAVDIKVKGHSPDYVAKIALKCGFSWVKAYSTFTHIDIREIKLAKRGE